MYPNYHKNLFRSVCWNWIYVLARDLSLSLLPFQSDSCHAFFNLSSLLSFLFSTKKSESLQPSLNLSPFVCVCADHFFQCILHEMHLQWIVEAVTSDSWSWYLTGHDISYLTEKILVSEIHHYYNEPFRIEPYRTGSHYRQEHRDTHTHALNTQTTPFESSFYSCSVYSE